MSNITLTPDQQNASDKFQQFLLDPVETVFVLSGFAGTGKSTLVRVLLEELPSFMSVAKLINPDMQDYMVELTATTNKAAEVLREMSGKEVRTIHSFLGLRVSTDYETKQTKLVPRSAERKTGYLIFVDEASYIDKYMLGLIFKLTDKCKIVFMGDSAQLAPVNAVGTPVFNANFSGAQLTQVMRQAAGNPIVELSTKFRETVNTGEFFSFVPDGDAVKYLDRDSFNLAIEEEFSRPDWQYKDSKVLGWTNKCVVKFNHDIRDHVKGDPHFQVNDYAIVNKFVSVGREALKTDQLVRITTIGPDKEVYGVKGNSVILDGIVECFFPKSLAAKNLRIKQARANDDFTLVEHMESKWIDLRAAYSQTINKSQGSTYDSVYIDLDDVRRCNNGDTLARLLYVAVSRAKHKVYLTGDIA